MSNHAAGVAGVTNVMTLPGTRNKESHLVGLGPQVDRVDHLLCFRIVDVGSRFGFVVDVDILSAGRNADMAQPFPRAEGANLP